MRTEKTSLETKKADIRFIRFILKSKIIHTDKSEKIRNGYYPDKTVIRIKPYL